MKTTLLILTVFLAAAVRAYPPAPATQAQVNAGTETYKYVTPATLAGLNPLTNGQPNVTLSGTFNYPSNTWTVNYAAATNGLAPGSFVDGVNSNGLSVWTLWNSNSVIVPVAHKP